MENLLKVLPLAVVMVAGPQIITAIMLATSEKARRNSAAYVGGAILASAVSTAVFFYLAKALGLEPSEDESGHHVFNWILVGVLLLAALRVFQKRNDTQPPKYMAKLQAANPRGSFWLGFLLFLVMPTDVLMTFTVGTFLASHGNPLWWSIGFLLLTALLIGSPLILLLLLGRRTATLLPALRTWMNQNSWIVSEVVIALFVVLQLQSIFGD